MASIQNIPLLESLKVSNPKLNGNFSAINSQVINHVNGTSDKHSLNAIINDSEIPGNTGKEALNGIKERQDAHAEGVSEQHNLDAILNDSEVPGGTGKEALNAIKERQDAHAAGTAERHSALDITHSGPAGGDNVQTALNNLKGAINNIVSTPGTEHDPLVTAALVDIESEDFGPTGNNGGIDRRHGKWEQRTKNLEAFLAYMPINGGDFDGNEPAGNSIDGGIF